MDGARQPQNYYSWSDQISWTHGKNSIRAGFEGQHVNWLSIGYSADRGSLTFQNFSDFLVGQSAAQNGSPLGFSNVYAAGVGVTVPGGQILDLISNSSAAFIENDFKVTKNLTLNLGIRWEYLGHEFDSDRANGGFDTWLTLLNTAAIPPPGGTYAGYTVANNYNGFLPQGVYQRSTNAADQTGAPWNNFEPRIGFAWQPLHSERLAVRGGFGSYYNMINGTPQIFNQE